MASSTYQRPPARVEPQVGIGSGAFPGGAGTYIGKPTPSGSPGGIDVGAAISGLLSSIEASAQVGLGLVLVLVGLILVASTTQAGAMVGSGAMGAARQGARFIPVVGGLVR